jgi:hypothetical protein
MLRTCVSPKPTHDIVLIIINIAASKNANEDADQLHSSEEERTPGGGTKQELVAGHSYRIARLSDAQLVVSDLAPTPPNMVTGYNFLDFKGNFNGNVNEWK